MSRGVAVLLALVGVAALVAGESAAKSSQSGKIYACVSKGSGALRVISARAKCRSAESPLSWSTGAARGISGSPGPRGPAGSRGPTGVAGPRGETGPNGEIGLQGARGVPGAAGGPGPAGEQGPAGAQGPLGPRGATGAQGPQGARGTVGPTGPRGAQGIQGPAGIQGPQGIQGSQGSRGSTGPAGPAGSQLIVGSSANGGLVTSDRGASKGTTITASVSCPSGKLLLGGGGAATNDDGHPERSVLTQSFPLSTTTWQAVGLVADTSLSSTKRMTVQAWAICSL